MRLGVLAFGSLISNPGWELDEITAERLTAVATPFRVEYARHSLVRGGAPTLVPVNQGGSRVSGVMLVIADGIDLAEVRDRTYRRERNAVGSGLRYRHVDNPSPDAVHLPVIGPLAGIDAVIHVVLGDTIPDPDRTPENLARMAIASVSKNEAGRDGISYLRDAIGAGIETPLTGSYRQAILSATATESLDEALAKVRSGS
ncbi:MAG: hypothetical protein WEA76_01295 [Acidimicrobiia bacterium]